MLTKDTILAMLKEGKSVDDVTELICDAINEAEAEYEEFQKQEEEKKAFEQRKYAAANQVLGAFCDYAIAIGEEQYVEKFAEVEIETLVTMLDEVFKLAKSLDNFKTLEFKYPRDNRDFGLFSKVFDALF